MRRGAEMGRADHMGMAEERTAAWRLDGENVDGGAGDPTPIERRAQIRLDDQFAARAIDDPLARLAFRQSGGIEDMARLGGQWRMEAEDIGAR